MRKRQLREKAIVRSLFAFWKNLKTPKGLESESIHNSSLLGKKTKTKKMKKLVHLQFLFLVKIFVTQFFTLSSSSFAASYPSIAPVYTSMTTFSPGLFFSLVQPIHFFLVIFQLLNIDCSLNFLNIIWEIVVFLLIPFGWLNCIYFLFNFWVSGFYLCSSNFENQNEICFFVFDNWMLFISYSPLVFLNKKNCKKKILYHFLCESWVWIQLNTFHKWNLVNELIDEPNIFCFLVSGILMGSGQEHRLDAHKKLLIGLIISSSSLGIIILICFGFWIYCRKKAPKPIKISGNFIIL